MTQTHFRESATDPPVPPTSPLPISPDLLDKIYSPERIEKALQSFDPLKAAGPDTLKPIIFQKAWTHIKDITKNIMTKKTMECNTFQPCNCGGTPSGSSSQNLEKPTTIKLSHIVRSLFHL